MEEFDYMPHAISEFNKLNNSEIRVGILDKSGNFLQMIAIVNNNGCFIHAKNYPKLRIPVKLSNGKTGYVFKESVTIPARRFMEKTITDHENEWIEYLQNGILSISSNDNMSAKTIMDNLGRQIISEMQDEMNNWTSPSNAPLTIQNKGKDNPLIDTGKLRDSIDYEIVDKI